MLIQSENWYTELDVSQNTPNTHTLFSDEIQSSYAYCSSPVQCFIGFICTERIRLFNSSIIIRFIINLLLSVVNLIIFLVASQEILTSSHSQNHADSSRQDSKISV